MLDWCRMTPEKRQLGTRGPQGAMQPDSLVSANKQVQAAVSNPGTLCLNLASHTNSHFTKPVISLKKLWRQLWGILPVSYLCVPLKLVLPDHYTLPYSCSNLGIKNLDPSPFFCSKEWCSASLLPLWLPEASIWVISQHSLVMGWSMRWRNSSWRRDVNGDIRLEFCYVSFAFSKMRWPIKCAMSQLSVQN